MSKILLGNVRGPEGQPGKSVVGPRGKTGQRGNRIVFGTAITGTNTEEKSYPTGIADSLQNDVYWNEETCNIYVCTVPGDEMTAKWTYIGNSKGEKTVVENVLTSINVKNALSALCGNKLLQCIIRADAHAAEIHLQNTENARTFVVQVTPGVESVVTFIDDDGNEYTSGAFKEDPLKETEIILKSSELGIPSNAVIRKMKSSGGKIQRVVARDSLGKILFESKPSEQYIFELQDKMNDLLNDMNEFKESVPNFHYGVEEPAEDIGEDLDIYFKIEE